VLLIIVGAGASYDSVPHLQEPHQWRPPLADQLFDIRFAEWARAVRQIQPILPFLRSRPDGKSVEQVLDGLATEAADDPERLIQLAGVRLYLHCLFRDLERRWPPPEYGPPTTYLTLFDEVRHFQPGETTALVTFNYDRILEGALEAKGLRMETIDDYIAPDRPWWLFKVHGSSNWGREVGFQINAVGAWQDAHELIERAAEWVLGEFHIVNNDWPIHRWEVVRTPRGSLNAGMVPAISVPFTTKPSFELPDSHMSKLIELMPQVTRLLVIGWRAGDQPFLDLLKEHMRQPVQCMIVSLSKPDDIIERLQLGGGVAGTFSTVVGGFTQFITGRRLAEWISQTQGSEGSA